MARPFFFRSVVVLREPGHFEKVASRHGRQTSKAEVRQTDPGHNMRHHDTDRNRWAKTQLLFAIHIVRKDCCCFFTKAIMVDIKKMKGKIKEF